MYLQTLCQGDPYLIQDTLQEGLQTNTGVHLDLPALVRDGRAAKAAAPKASTNSTKAPTNSTNQPPLATDPAQNLVALADSAYPTSTPHRELKLKAVRVLATHSQGVQGAAVMAGPMFGDCMREALPGLWEALPKPRIRVSR